MPLGYAFLRIASSGPTWNLGDRVGDLESLSVTAGARGMGVGWRMGLASMDLAQLPQ